MFRSLTLLILATAALAPAEATALSGWYVGGSNSTSFNPNTGNWSSGVTWEYYRFFPDGRVYWGWKLPKNITMDAFDRSPSPAEAGNYGTYTITGGRIHLVWRVTVRSPENWPFTEGRGWITMAGTNYYQIASCNGLQLSGFWGTSSYAAVGRGGGVAGSRGIAFTPDGRFEQRGFVGFRGSNALTSRNTAGAGTYRITGNTLELSYSNGRREQLSFYLFPKEEKKLIVIDGAMYMRR